MGDIKFVVLTVCAVLVSVYGTDSGNDGDTQTLLSPSECEVNWTFCKECADLEDRCKEVRACESSTSVVDSVSCLEQEEDSIKLLCELCLKSQKECKSAPKDCTKGNKSWPFPVPTFRPSKPNKPSNQKPDNCKKQGDSCAYIGDRSCCPSFSCEEASEEGKFKCILLVNDQKPSNSGNATSPAKGI